MKNPHLSKIKFTTPVKPKEGQKPEKPKRQKPPKMPVFNVRVIPESDQASANSWLDSMYGMGPNTFSVPLVSSGGPANATPTSHFLTCAAFEVAYPGSMASLQAAFPSVQGTDTPNVRNPSSAINAWLPTIGLQKQTP